MTRPWGNFAHKVYTILSCNAVRRWRQPLSRERGRYLHTRRGFHFLAFSISHLSLPMFWGMSLFLGPCLNKGRALRNLNVLGDFETSFDFASRYTHHDIFIPDSKNEVICCASSFGCFTHFLSENYE